ncbi:MAG: Flp pilus assembly complex ATPase component TadA [Clostridia bacterium]|nr:Flp pilus assembly complex ATPase component TadA [Clostridia bacterium]
MAIFDNSAKKVPLGVYLIRKNLISEKDIDTALAYQKEHPEKRLGEIFHILNLCRDEDLLKALAERLGVKYVQLDPLIFEKFNCSQYISLDIIRQHKVVPFGIEEDRLKVAFADPEDTSVIKMVNLILLNKGLKLDRYLTFGSYIDKMIQEMDRKAGKAEVYDVYGQDTTQLVDNIIRSAMSKRTSDIHFEPMDNRMRIRFRIDGELIEVASIDKDKQQVIVGRLKAISNMHQEKQESQDGRIVSYPDYNIRVSSQRNIHGEKFVLRLLKKNANIKGLFDLGFPNDEAILNKCFNKRNCIALVAAPTGEGKTTTLYSVMKFLSKPTINITTIEDPVEIRVPGLNQVEVTPNETFADALRTILRQDPDIVLVGEIRDKETAEIAIQAGQTGHFVLSTIHTVDSIEAITRLKKLGVSAYDVGSVLATCIAQRLIRRICTNCAKEREFTPEEIEEFKTIGKRYNHEFNLEGKHTYEPVGCEKCNKTGFYERIAAIEILSVDDNLRDLIIEDKSASTIRKAAFESGYRPLVVDAFEKVLQGITTVAEVRNKLAY